MSVRVNLLAGLALVPICGMGDVLADAPPAVLGQPVKAALKGARASLATDVSTLKPGASATLAIVFEIAPKWHIYWDGINDTGQPPKIVEKSLPKGVTLGEIKWPAPTRHVEPGDIVDHIYETRAVLLVPVTLAKDAKVGETLTIGLSLEWMECANVCRMGSAKLETSIVVGEQSKATPDAKMITEVESALPKVATAMDGFSAVMEHGVLKITAKDADAIAYFPAENSSPPKDRVAGCEGKGGVLEIEMNPGEGKIRPVRGIISVRKGKESRYFTIETPAATSTKQDGPAGVKGTDTKK